MICIKGMNEDLEGLMSPGVPEVWLVGHFEWAEEIQMNLNDKWPVGHSGQRNPDQALFLPMEVLGGPKDHCCSHQYILVMWIEDPPLSGQAGWGRGT